MAAAGYMTEADVESIWGVALDTTRFGKVNVRLGELLNIVVHGDATTAVTDTKILPFLEEFSEELLLELYSAAKAHAVHDPWDFIGANVSSFFIRKYKECGELFDMIRKIANYTESIEIVSLSGFGASNDL